MKDLKSILKELRLTEFLSQYEDVVKVAEKENKSYEDFLLMLAHEELKTRENNRIKRTLADSKIPVSKEIENFEFKNRKGVTVQEIKRLAEGHFIKSAGNIVFYGGTGVGKTHLAIALVKKLCEKGFKCLYTRTDRLIEQLIAAKRDYTLGSVWKKFDKYDLIACDELGFLSQTQEGSDLFFQFISERYERKSLMITTNLAYTEWGQVFLNPITTAAAVDRIIHNCETFTITGDSHRVTAALKKNLEK